MNDLIQDPAVRLTAASIRALARRYDGTVDPIVATGDYAVRFGNVCDAVVQILWADRYGTGPDDPDMHTSDPARTLAYILLRAAGVHEPDADEA